MKIQNLNTFHDRWIHAAVVTAVVTAGTPFLAFNVMIVAVFSVIKVFLVRM
jgi:hypothetical protein